MTRVYFITHPEVQFDWSIPVPEWDLSVAGRARLEKLAARPWVGNLARIFASTERKAITTAGRLAKVNGTAVEFLPALREIDRSAAGTLAPEEYSRVTDQFFANPDQSARGWEKASAAQRRIMSTVNEILRRPIAGGSIAIVSHGGVGTLLLCHLKKAPIRRSEDQPGQGHFFVFTSDGIVESGWRPIDAET